MNSKTLSESLSLILRYSGDNWVYFNQDHLWAANGVQGAGGASYFFTFMSTPFQSGLELVVQGDLVLELIRGTKECTIEIESTGLKIQADNRKARKIPYKLGNSFPLPDKIKGEPLIMDFSQVNFGIIQMIGTYGLKFGEEIAVIGPGKFHDVIMHRGKSDGPSHVIGQDEAHHLKEYKGETKVWLQDSRVVLDDGRLASYLPVLESNFPDYKKMIPEGGIRVRADQKKVIEACKRINSFISKVAGSDFVRGMDISVGDQLKLSVEVHGSEMEEVLDCSADGEITVHANPTYFQQILALHQDFEVYFRERGPIVFRSPDVSALQIMRKM